MKKTETKSRRTAATSPRRWCFNLLGCIFLHTNVAYNLI